MTPERYQRIGQLFNEALELAPTERRAFLIQACGPDTELRDEVERLMAHHSEDREFLDRPAMDVAAALFAQQRTCLLGQMINHYKTLAQLGAGGMGEVWLAEDTRLGRKVALKLLPDKFASDPERSRRFLTEAKAASATDHPNIVTVHEIGESDGIHYIAQEYVEGETLRSRISQGPIPSLEALDIAHQIANALAAAHGAGIVHRDIKPENIMLRHDGFVKVLDFGLAGINQPEAMSENFSNAKTLPQNTAPGMILGTVNYMSPEQTRGQKLDARSDLWSLGVVLYEMLTGQRPFHGESMPDIFVAILERQPIPLAELLDDAPVQLQQILDKLLAKNREQRYQSSSQLAAELKRFHHRLELDAERNDSEVSESATLFIKQPVQTAEPRFAESLATQEQPRPIEPLSALNEPVTKEQATVARLSRATVVVVVFLFVAVIATASWMLFQQKAPATTEQLPERSFHYWLTVQMMRDGKPYREEFQSAGKERYESGSKFRFNFISPQSGYLYLINEGPAKNGISYWLLFPMPSVNGASAKIEANQTMATGRLTFNENTGDEKIWVIWSAQAIKELEALKADVLNPTEQGEIRNPQQRDIVRRLLTTFTQSKSADQEDRNNQQTAVTGRGDNLIHLVELKHH